MNKLTLSLILVFLMIFVFVPMALAAQNNPSDSELINAVTMAIAAFGALVANFLVNLVKTLPYLEDEYKDKLATAITEIVSVAVGLLTGWVVALLAQWLGLIEDQSLKVMIVSALTPVFNELRYRVAKLSPRKS